MDSSIWDTSGMRDLIYYIITLSLLQSSIGYVLAVLKHLCAPQLIKINIKIHIMLRA